VKFSTHLLVAALSSVALIAPSLALATRGGIDLIEGRASSKSRSKRSTPPRGLCPAG
jgi:hypothetical protein